MNTLAVRRTAIVVLILAVALLPVVAGALYVLRKHAWGEERLAQIEPRHARLLGLESQRAELEAARQRATELRTQYVYPAVSDGAQTGNQAQQKVRDLFSSAGLQVITSQVLPPKEEKGFDRIPLVLRAEGELLGLQSALAVLGAQQPFIVINELDVQVLGGLANINPKMPPRLSAQFTLSVLRERP
ncbi:general secretion pathway protein M [Acidovorax sp. 69]|uniref:type II secretion system protein GspM n=1 Tax=Acidovorax sp. 69 TaxID=2035202 RepID=UPI000C239F70|nr:type II secretion system protein GspM [Acidovorax sp. 69]PJI99198.1 general secretion pathway protein M [Acidovorax sp. 69]